MQLRLTTWAHLHTKVALVRVPMTRSPSRQLLPQGLVTCQVASLTTNLEHTAALVRGTEVEAQARLVCLQDLPAQCRRASLLLHPAIHLRHPAIRLLHQEMPALALLLHLLDTWLLLPRHTTLRHRHATVRQRRHRTPQLHQQVTRQRRLSTRQHPQTTAQHPQRSWAVLLHPRTARRHRSTRQHRLNTARRARNTRLAAIAAPLHLPRRRNTAQPLPGTRQLVLRDPSPRHRRGTAQHLRALPTLQRKLPQVIVVDNFLY